MNLAMDEVEKLKRPGIGFRLARGEATSGAIKRSSMQRWPGVAPEFINRLTKVDDLPPAHG